MREVIDEFIRLACIKYGSRMKWNGQCLTIDGIRLHVHESMAGKRVCIAVGGEGVSGFPDAWPYGLLLGVVEDKLANEKLARKKLETG